MNGHRQWNDSHIYGNRNSPSNYQINEPSSQPDVRNQYIKGEHLGSENRELEFKAGPGFIRNGYREQVAKYICAFANSHVSGKVLLGVDDDGNVRGCDLNHREEDELRRDTDEAVKDINPTIFPQDYSVRVVPVVDYQQHPVGNEKVIEICIYGNRLTEKDVLYSCKKKVFQRRDGGVHELSASDIQAWTKQKYIGDIERLQKELKTAVSEKRQVDQKLIEKDEELRRRQLVIDKQISQLNQQEQANVRLMSENHECRSQQAAEKGNEAASQQVLEAIGELRKDLSAQKNKSSKVCVVS